MRRRFYFGAPSPIAILISCAAVAAAVNASAADPTSTPTKEQCIAANESAQTLRQQGHLSATRAQLLVCLSKGCPGPLREDCAARLNDLENVTPTIVFIAKAGDGTDLAAVQVKMDGVAFIDHLDGSAISVEPGAHSFELTTKGYPSVTKQLVVHEGEKARTETVTFGAPATAKPMVVVPAPAPTSPTYASNDDATKGNGQRLVSYVLGGAGIVGIGVGSVFGLVASSTYHDAASHCPTSSTCTSDGVSGGQSAHNQATISTVAFIAGGALLAGGVVLYLTAPKHGSVSVQTSAGAGSIGLRVGGSF